MGEKLENGSEGSELGTRQNAGENGRKQTENQLKRE